VYIIKEIGFQLFELNSMVWTQYLLYRRLAKYVKFAYKYVFEPIFSKRKSAIVLRCFIIPNYKQAFLGKIMGRDMHSTVAKNLGKLNHWLKLLFIKYPLLGIPFLVFVVLFVICPLACVFSLIAFYLPWIPGILIPLCLTIFLILLFIGYISKGLRRRASWNTAIKLYLIPACFWGSVFVFAGISAYISTELNLKMLSSKSRFPLSDIRAVAVDGKGLIYCLSRDYNRLQVFNPAGKFLRGWFVNIPMGKYYRLLVDENDNLIVASKKGGEKTFFNSSGKLLRKDKISDYDQEFGLEIPIEVKDKLGNSYKPDPAVQPVRIIKTSSSGEETILIKDPFNLWLLNAFPGVGLFVGLGIVCIGLRITIKKESISNS